MEFLCDRKRHLICIPYSIENLHLMAEMLNIQGLYHREGRKKNKWHYDIPKRRIQEIQNQCTIVTDREIITIINNYKNENNLN